MSTKLGSEVLLGSSGKKNRFTPSKTSSNQDSAAAKSKKKSNTKLKTEISKEKHQSVAQPSAKTVALALNPASARTPKRFVKTIPESAGSSNLRRKSSNNTSQSRNRSKASHTPNSHLRENKNSKQNTQ
jgi:hypothetical protein